MPKEKERNPTLQELSLFLWETKNSDIRIHEIECGLRISNPICDNGCVGFNGLIWNQKNKNYPCVSIGFNYNEKDGITNFLIFRDNRRIAAPENISFSEFQEIVKREFSIEKFGEYHTIKMTA